MHQDVVIVGAGIAGCVLARLLAADGWRVTVIGESRPPSWEGLSPRAQDGLHRVGCTAAAALCASPSPRRGIWNGRPAAANREFLFSRADLDAALRADARASGARMVEGRVFASERTPTGWRVDVQGHPPVTADFLVEARGRAALAHGSQRWVGARTVALARHFAFDAPQASASGVGAFADGWAWFAIFGGTRLVVQLVTDAAQAGDHERLLDAAARDIPPLAELLAHARPVDRMSARDATPRMADGLVEERYLRVGDAAYAPDPLSGQGIYESVGGAMTAYRHIGTVLTRPDHAQASARFVWERAVERFSRLTHAGRDFYRAERRWSDRPFWRRRAEQDLSALPELATATAASVRDRPVAALRTIEPRPVVISAQHPRGVWSIADVPVAALLAEVAAGGTASMADLCRRFRADERRIGLALAWLRSQGALPVTANVKLPPLAAHGI